jgi:hypothetical protein
VDSKIRSHGAYSVDDLRLRAEPSESLAPYDWPDTGASLILISLLSLGLWAATWGAVAALASTVLR